MQVAETIPGGIIYHSLSVSEPGGSFWVRCDRHPDYTVQVHHNYFAINGFDAKKSILDTAIETLAKCPNCVAEKQSETTRTCAQEEHDACGCQQ